MAKNYTVIVSGTELFRSTDFLLAHASAHSYRQIRWKDVKEGVVITRKRKK